MNTQNTINTSYIPPYLIDCINNKDIESIDIEKKQVESIAMSIDSRYYWDKNNPHYIKEKIKILKDLDIISEVEKILKSNK